MRMGTRNQKTIARFTILSGSILLAGSQPAMAQVSGAVHLICRPSGGAANVMVQDSPTIVDLDEAQGTATIHFASFHLQGFISGPIPARTVGPMHATFSEEAVVFDNPDPNSAPNGGQDRYSLNRLTGDLSGKWGEDEMNCQAAVKRS